MHAERFQKKNSQKKRKTSFNTHISTGGRTMKQFTTIMFVAGVVAIFIAATPQEKQQKKMDPAKHMQMMEMMKDSTAMNMMMEHMMDDRGMRMKMMEKMMEHTKGDSSSMMEM